MCVELPLDKLWKIRTGPRAFFKQNPGMGLFKRSDSIETSSETRGWLVGARGNKAGKEMKRRRFTSKAEKTPRNRLLPDHFQTALPMLPPDWGEKSFVLFCSIGEQQLLRYCGVFSHDYFASPNLLGSLINVLHVRETFILISLESGEISKWWLEIPFRMLAPRPF